MYTVGLSQEFSPYDVPRVCVDQIAPAQDLTGSKSVS